jgi:thiol-disulfide isomerase/thioredoxin
MPWPGQLLRRALLLLTTALAAAAAACEPDLDAYRPLQAGDAAPDYAARVLTGELPPGHAAGSRPAGETADPAADAGPAPADTISLSDLRGSIVMLNIWATWCPPCREEMPALQQLHDSHAGRGLRVVGVSIDSALDEGAVNAFAASLGITFLILHDPADHVSRAFRTTGVPETFLIDADGRIVRRWIGRFDPLAPDVIDILDAHLSLMGSASPESEP